MIGRPTTAQVLLDCAREVRESVAPAVTDPTVRVRLQMLELLLASCAVRAGHEIEWMAEESAEMVAFASDVLAAHPDESLAVLHDAALAEPAGLALDDRVASYDRVGRAFAAALELAMAAGDEDLSARAKEIVGRRRDHESETRPDFYMPGRS